MIRNLEKYNFKDGKIIGNKAVNLLKLTSYGVTTPETWVYEATIPIELLKSAGLYQEGVQLEDFNLARSYFDNLPRCNLEKIKCDVMQYLSEHRGIAFVLRSSNSLEDGLNKSFAGAFMSKININKPTCLLDAIIEIWKSSFSDIVYELCLKYKIERVDPCAVIIQKLVNAQIGGIAVKLNDKCILHAGYGLTKGAVDDVYEPDCWVVNEDGIIADEIKGKKSKAVYPVFTRTTPLMGEAYSIASNWVGTVCSNLEKSTITVNLPAEASEKMSLTHEQVYKLYRTFEYAAQRCKKNNYDIEWCLDQFGELYLLQIREVSNSFLNYRKGENAMPLAPGTAMGVIKYIGRYEDAQNFPNDAIILAKKIDGAVLHVISKARGCIIESSELLSHSAIIARELGVPSIGIEDIAEIKKNEMYFIDGNKGEYFEVGEEVNVIEPSFSDDRKEEQPQFGIIKKIAEYLIKTPKEWEVSGEDIEHV